MPAPMTRDERIRKLNSINELLQNSGYIYSYTKSSIDLTIMPPPEGKELNCEAVARLFFRMALDMGVEETAIEGMHYNGGQGSKGYFVLDENGTLRALGNRALQSEPQFSGWAFSHHWRVRDIEAQIIFDPTFGTSSATGGNPIGIKCTSEEMLLLNKKMQMVSEYGDKYRVVSGIGSPTTHEIYSNAVVSVHNQITDEDFQRKPVTNLVRPAVEQFAPLPGKARALASV